MKFKRGSEIITTFDIKVQQQLMEQGLTPIDVDMQPNQEEVTIVDEYTVKKKPVRKA